MPENHIADATDEELAEYNLLLVDREYINKVSIEHNVKCELFFNKIRVRTGVYTGTIDLEGNKILQR